MTGFKIEPGNSPTTYWPPDPYAELAELQTWYYKTFQLGIAPAQNAGLAGATYLPPQAVAAAIPVLGSSVRWPSRMLKAPTVVLFNPQTASAQVRNINVPADGTEQVLAILMRVAALYPTHRRQAALLATLSYPPYSRCGDLIWLIMNSHLIPTQFIVYRTVPSSPPMRETTTGEPYLAWKEAGNEPDPAPDVPAVPSSLSVDDLVSILLKKLIISQSDIQKK